MLTLLCMTCKNILTWRFDVSLHIKKNRMEGLPANLIRDLVRARHDHGWSQRDIASRVGLPQVHISAIETGKVAPRFNTLLDLVRILGFDLLLVPRPLVPAVQSLIRDAARFRSKGGAEDERPLYTTEDDGGDHGP
jgi:transcriptional regulator with XRE-family HTH domain